MTGPPRTRIAFYALTAAALGLAPALALAQEVRVESPAALRLRVTTASEEAGRHFWTGLGEARNIFFARAATHLDRAIALDGNFALARVVRGAIAPGLTTEERKAEVERGIATMTSAPTAELVTALGFRERVAGNNRQSQVLFASASKMLPGDPHLAFYSAQLTWVVEGPAKGVEAFRKVTERFPDDAASHNILAYLLWQTGERDAAFTAVKRYVELEPNHPNSHDSYAELLQWDGRFSEALAHYARSAQLDSSFVDAYLGMAEVLQLTGRGNEARTQIRQAIARAPATRTRVDYTRALARSFLLDGMLKEAMEQFAVAAQDAQANNQKDFAAQTHREMAVAEALLGRPTAIAPHLAIAAEIEGAEVPEQLIATAMAHGTAGEVPLAREAARKLATAAQTKTELATAVRVASAVVLLRENNAREALKELSQANAEDPVVRSLLAECSRATGNTAEARTLRSQVINDPQINLTDAHATIARVRATRIKV